MRRRPRAGECGEGGGGVWDGLCGGWGGGGEVWGGEQVSNNWFSVVDWKEGLELMHDVGLDCRCFGREVGV